MLPYIGISEVFENFLSVYKCGISAGQKTLFSKKCPIGGLLSEKKYIIFSISLRGGGSDPL